MGSLRTLVAIIEEAIEIHGDQFDYSRAIYLGAINKFEIGCKKCGTWFWQVVASHLQGTGCPGCKKINLHNRQKKDLSTFITEANVIHNYKYNYILFIYYNSYTKGIIICKEHGNFEQVPHNHLNGEGCPKCSILEATNKKRKSKEFFILECIEIYGNKYNYNNFIYINCKTKGKIICNDCNNIFEKASIHHLRGQGCIKCSNNNISNIENNWLDYLNISQEYRQKIIKVNNIRYKVDAYDSTINTIYEFNGDYWHGNPLKFAPNDINKRTKTTFGELYNKTLDKQLALEAAGYTVISIWENDWKEQNKGIK